MRTYVRMMGLGPHRPINDLEHALERGQLGIATGIAKDFARENGRPLPLDAALRFLPVIAAQQHGSYNHWACHWLGRWLSETPGATIDRAAEIAGALAEPPNEPTWLETIRQMLR